MGENKMPFDLDDFLDDLWPPTSALAGLVFATDDDFLRARALPREDFSFQLGNTDERYLVLRKVDLHRIVAAGMLFEEIELEDYDSLSPEEQYERDYAMIHSEAVQKAMAEMLQRLGRDG